MSFKKMLLLLLWFFVALLFRLFFLWCPKLKLVEKKERRECKLHSPVWSHIFTCSGRKVGEAEYGHGCWSIPPATRNLLTTECNKVLFFLYSHHLPAPCIIYIWDWFRRNVVANICEIWLFMKLLMLWQCWFRLPNVASFLYQSGCGYASKSIFVTVAYFGQGIFCQHKPPVQSQGYMEYLCRYISQSALYFGRLTPVALARTRQCKRWRVCMFASQHLLCVYADKSMGVMKNWALTVPLKFSPAVLLSPSVWCLGPDGRGGHVHVSWTALKLVSQPVERTSGIAMFQSRTSVFCSSIGLALPLHSYSVVRVVVQLLYLSVKSCYLK